MQAAKVKSGGKFFLADQIALWQVWKYFVSTDIISLDSFYRQPPLAIPPPPAVKVTPELPHTLCTSPHISLLLRNNIHEKVESRSQAVRQKATSPWACIWMDFLSFFFVTWFNWRVLLAGGGGDRDGQGITLIEFPFMSIRPWHSLSALFWEKRGNYGIAIFQKDWWFSIYLFNKRWHN